MKAILAILLADFFFPLDMSPAQREGLFNVFVWFLYGTGAHA